MRQPSRSIAYLSGAPRVSTRVNADASGPRSHILGVMRAFEGEGWRVAPYIVGDRLPKHWSGANLRRQMSRSLFSRAAADLLRLGLAGYHARKAAAEIGQVDWAYERLGLFQSLGCAFQIKGVPWILETNAPLFREARLDRGALHFHRLAQQVEMLAYQQCDVLVCVSNTLKDILVNEARIPPEKVIVMPNGVDTELFDPQKTSPRRIAQCPALGFVGTLYPWQALDVLIESLAELRAEAVHYCLVVVGDGPGKTAWQTLAGQRGMSDQVHFIGHVPHEHVAGYIAGFDLGYSAPHVPSAGAMYFSPLKLYEYLAMGKPVVAAAYEDARRVVRQGECGYLFEPGNRADLKETLRRAYRESHLWDGLGRKAREGVLSSHTWQSRIRRLIPEVERILAARQGVAA